MVTEKLGIYQNNQLTSLKNQEVELVEPVQMNIYESNTYIKDLISLYSDNEPHSNL